MVLCLFIYFLAVHFDWSIILIRKSFGASRHISGKLGVKLAITNSNVSKITAAITLQITFEKGRCHGDILRKQVNII